MSHAGFFQYFRAFLECGAGRGDVIDEPNRFPFQFLSKWSAVGRERKGSFQVRLSLLGSVTSGLWQREAMPDEHIGPDGDRHARHEFGGERFGE